MSEERLQEIKDSIELQYTLAKAKGYDNALLFTNEEEELIEEIERLNKENNDLRKLYQRTYKHLFEIGNDELARYFQAQIDECRTFYVEPIIDYYEETKRLNNNIKEVLEYLDISNMSFVDKNEIAIRLKGSDKE